MFTVNKIFLTILLSFIAGWLFLAGIMNQYNAIRDKKQFISFVAFVIILLFDFVSFIVVSATPGVVVK